MQPGRLVGNRFEVAFRAGQGGMGVVYRARDTLTGEAVAIKVLHSATEQQVVRFAREARVLADLRHPAIVHYVAHGQTETGEPFLAMEWLEGEDLADRLARQTLGFAESLTVASRVADALAAVHARGVVHRDLKPSNLFLVDRNPARVKLLDFGIARLEHTGKVTRTGATVGTPGYMAPEQARGGKIIDSRADVFSLGCVLFECLTGRPAFMGEHVMALLAKILFEEPPRMSEIRRALPRDVVELVERMLAKAPADRPLDGAAVREELSRIDASAVVDDALLSAARGPSAIPAALTHGAQELVSVVVVAAPPSVPDEAVAATLVAGAPGLDRGALRDALRPFGAELEWLADGSAVAAITARGAATDQAVRAARCALAIRRALPGVAQVVATGRGVLTARLPIGEVIDRAVKLLRSIALSGTLVSGTHESPARAPAGHAPIGLDAVTAGLLPERFEVVKGGVAAELRAEREAVDAARTLLGRPSPFVGRAQELTLLIGLLRQVVTDRVARAALVTAPPGVGKSRLREELVREAQRLELGSVEVWMAVGDPMRAGAPLGLVTDVLRRLLGLVDDEPVEGSRARIRSRVGRHLAGADAGRVSDFLAEICGVRSLEGESVELRAARSDLMLMGEQMRRAWIDFLRAETGAAPVLLVLEDLHWGDVPTTKYIDAALRELRDRPLMVLALSRSEIDEQFPKLWAGRGLTRLDLGELPPRSCEELARKILGDSTSRETVDRLVEQSAGNAFFLEELIRAVAEGGTSLPGTVMAMVQARLAALEDGARRALRGASVFGQVFWRGGVSALFGGERVTTDLHDWLEDLAEREIVSARGEGRFRGDVEYEFRHGVVRDAAYALLTDEDRVLGHRLAGEWLERMGEREAAVLAEHFERGGELARAVEQYRRAAAHAFEGNDLDGTVAAAERGVACGAEGEALGALRHLQAEAHYFRGRHAEAHQAGRAAVAALPSGSGAWYAALATTVAASDKAGDVASAAALVDALCAARPDAASLAAYVTAAARCATHLLTAGRSDLAEALLERIRVAAADTVFTEPIVAGRIHLARAVRALFQGDPAGYFDLVSRAADEFERAGDLRTAYAARGNAGHACMELGSYAQAHEILRDVLAVATRIGLDNVAAWVSHNLGVVLAHQGSFGEAREIEQRAVDAGVAQGDRRLEISARIALAQIIALEGDATTAEEMAREVLASPLDSAGHRLRALATLASALNAQQRFPEALEEAQVGMELLTTMGHADADEALLRLAHAEALFGAGQQPAAELAISEARDHLAARAERVSDPLLRERFLSAVPTHATTFARARAWHEHCSQS